MSLGGEFCVLLSLATLIACAAETPVAQTPPAPVQPAVLAPNAPKPNDAFPQEKASIAITDEDIVFGDRNAPLTAVLYGGYTKSLGKYTHRVRQVLAERYGSQIRFVFKDFYMKHWPDQSLAAEGAHAAFAESPATFEKLAGLLSDFEGTVTNEGLVGLAQLAGANRQRFQQAIETHKYAPMVAASMRQVDALHMRGAPTTFINGIAVTGSVTNKWEAEGYEVIGKELDAIAKALASGVAARDIYGFRCSNNLGKKLLASERD
jgi:protein-disulfide isomerase